MPGLDIIGLQALVPFNAGHGIYRYKYVPKYHLNYAVCEIQVYTCHFKMLSLEG